MLYILLIFSSISIFKSILLSEFYSNFLLFTIYPLELALLSFNNNLYDIIIKWIVNGWFRLNIELDIIVNIQQFEDYVVLISWLVTFGFYNLYIFLKYRKKINKFIYISYILKFLIINYLSIFLWSLNIIINYEDIQYFSLLQINIFLFNFITFWFPWINFQLYIRK